MNISKRQWGSSFMKVKIFNSLWPRDAIWRQRSMSILARVMSCCLTAPSHYLDQSMGYVAYTWHWFPTKYQFILFFDNYVIPGIYLHPLSQMAWYGNTFRITIGEGLTLIAAWISNYTHYNVWDEITYPFLNFNGATVEVYQWISNFILQFIMDVITYPCWD